MCTSGSLAGRRSRVRICTGSAPDLGGELHDHSQLRPLLVLGEDVALLGRRESALRRQAKLIKGDVFGCLFDPPLDIGLLLQGAGLGGDETEYDDLVTLGQKAQRLETASPLAVVLQKIRV